MENTSTNAPTLTGPALSFVLATLLRCLPQLRAREVRELAVLGFNEQSIAQAGYRVAPGVEYVKRADRKTSKSEIVKLIIEAELNSPRYFADIFCAGLRAPGFYFDGQAMRLNLPPDRVVVPVKNARAQVVALQTYRTVRDTAPEWFESPGLPRGARAQRAAHFARAQLARTSGGIVIAEHTRAADAHAWAHEEAAVALNDLLPWVFARRLRESLPEVALVAFAYPYPDAELLRALYHYNFEVHDSARQEAA